MKNVWAIVPAKPFREGKSRLASILPDSLRWELNRQLLAHTLQILNGVEAVEKVLVISRDSEALALARRYHAGTILENGQPELNVSLSRATLFAQQVHAQALLILPVDLPLLDADVLNRLLERACQASCAVIVPDRHHRGTNALLLAPPGRMDYHFGEDSFSLHQTAARVKYERVDVFEDPRLGLDLDTEQDYLFYQSLNHETADPTISLWRNL